MCSIVHSVVCGSSDGSSDFSTLTKSLIKRKFSIIGGSIEAPPPVRCKGEFFNVY